MRILSFPLAAALLSACLPAIAAPCYVIYDRNDAVVFRDYKAPFDLTDSREQDSLRRQGQHLLIAEFGDTCNPVGFISATTGASTASVDEIVNDVRPAIASSLANSGAVQGGARPGAKPAPQTATTKK